MNTTSRNDTTYRRSTNRNRNLGWIVAVVFAAISVFCTAPANAAPPIPLTITWDKPTAGQTSLVRVKSDANMWSFVLVLDGVYISSGPTWVYPGSEAADPAWGLWAETPTTLAWSGAEAVGTFSVSVKGKIKRIHGGGGGGGGAEEEEKDFEATWDGQSVKADLSCGVAEEIEESVGAKIGVNGVVGLGLAVTPTPPSGKVTLTGPSGPKPVKVWLDAAKTQPLTLPKEWTIGTGPQMPDMVYVEATAPSGGMRDVSYTLTYTNPPDAAASADTVKITIARLVFEVKHKGVSDTHYGSSAKAAAGAKATDAHKAEVRVTAKLPDDSVLAGVTVNPPVDISQGHGELTDWGDPTNDPAISLYSYVTDADGTVKGEFTSSDRTETAVMKIPYDVTQSAFDIAKLSTTAGPTISVDQQWNELAGDTAHIDPVDGFTVGEPQHLNYYMQMDIGDGVKVPIDKHSIRFETTSLAGMEWNSTLPIDIDNDGTVDYVGEYEPGMTYDAGTDAAASIGPGGIYTDLVQPGNGTKASETTPGKYETDIVVNDYVGPSGDVDFYVDYIGMDAVDDSSYARK